MKVRSRTAGEVRLDILLRRELALIDLRDESVFAAGHPLFASHLSLDRLELEVAARIPRRACPITLYDNGEGLVPQAMERLARLGYTSVSSLDRGLQGWKNAGFEVFTDVNSYAKAFGELVEVRRHTPSLSAAEVRALIEDRRNVVVLDARPYDEYHRMSVPTAINVPGVELVTSAKTLAPDPDTTIIVNCAGRTRSLIGTQSLINAGVPNRVVALRNGTIGWLLAGFTLETGQARRGPAGPVAGAPTEILEHTHNVAYRAGVKWLGQSDFERLTKDRTRTLYRFDVRTAEEYAARHLRTFRHAPGGQLVQEIDLFAPVRGARIALADDNCGRAATSAAWLAQLGFEAYVIEVGQQLEFETGFFAGESLPLRVAERVTAGELAELVAESDPLVIDIETSDRYSHGHIPGAAWAKRSKLLGALTPLPAGTTAVVLTSEDGLLAELAAADLSDALPFPVRTLAGGTRGWAATGRALQPGAGSRLTDGDDVYRRPYVGTSASPAAMQAYLDWEGGLVAQLERDGTHGFIVI